MKKNYKLLMVINIILIFLLVLGGCSSDTPAPTETNTDPEVNLIDPPERLQDSTQTASNINPSYFMANISKVFSNYLEPKVKANEASMKTILEDRMYIYTISRVTMFINKYLEPKIKKIFQIEENTFNYTLKEFYMENSNATIENQFDITISKNLNFPYDQKYDLKYTIKYADTDEIKTVLFTNQEKTRFNMMEKYKIKMDNYKQDGHYFQVIHNENDKYTQIKIHEESNEDPQGKSVTYITDNFVRLKEKDDTKEYEFVRIGDGSETKKVASFSSVENRSNNNITACFHYKSNNADSTTPYYENLTELESMINGETDFPEPMKIGYIEGEKNYNFPAENFIDFEAKENYPSGDQVKARYNELIEFKTLSQVEFNTQKMKYEGMTFLDSLGIVK